ncbi:MAG: helix-turn-helix domain-containing protein [Lachnospiraceae bacterium]|nr:helix-turn-helix domain-containing protein [Lachnospiraceae bacterium]
MYGVYLVDDERLVIEDLIDNVPWPENGFTVVGWSTVPARALQEIKELKPDVVFCDLRMPGSDDGIKLIKKIKDSGINTEYIMLSAFAEFEASRDFFTMGGFDYLIKPLEHDNAALILEKISRKIAEKHHRLPLYQFIRTQTLDFDDLVTYVIENFSKRVTLADLSEKFGMSQTYICDLFAKHYDSTLMIFLTDIRMKEAGRLIKASDTPIKEIAIHCGYGDYSYFCRVFKAHYNQSPTEYREER